MENTAQGPAIVSRTRPVQRSRALRSSRPLPSVASAVPPDRQRRAWLAQVDQAATPNERGLLFWMDTAARYHTDPVRDVIVALKTIEGPARSGAEGPTLYVWEVAWCRGSDGIKWQFVVWDVSGYGVRFLDCAGRAEAMALYNLPAEQGITAVQHAPGVYLRAERRRRKALP